MRLTRGGIFRVRLNPVEGSEQRGQARPCVVVHRDTLETSSTALVIPLTTQTPRAGFPLTVHLPPGIGGNPKESWAKITQLRVVAKTRFVTPAIGYLSEAELETIKSALRAVLDL